MLGLMDQFIKANCIFLKHIAPRVTVCCVPSAEHLMSLNLVDGSSQVR